MADATLTITANTRGAREAIGAMARSRSSIGELAQFGLKVGDLAHGLVFVEGDDSAARSAGELVVRFNPSQRCRRLVFALRARERQLLIVEKALTGHENPTIASVAHRNGGNAGAPRPSALRRS